MLIANAITSVLILNRLVSNLRRVNGLSCFGIVAT